MNFNTLAFLGRQAAHLEKDAAKPAIGAAVDAVIENPKPRGWLPHMGTKSHGGVDIPWLDRPDRSLGQIGGVASDFAVPAAAGSYTFKTLQDSGYGSHTGTNPEDKETYGVTTPGTLAPALMAIAAASLANPRTHVNAGLSAAQATRRGAKGGLSKYTSELLPEIKDKALFAIASGVTPAMSTVQDFQKTMANIQETTQQATQKPSEYEIYNTRTGDVEDGGGNISPEEHKVLNPLQPKGEKAKQVRTDRTNQLTQQYGSRLESGDLAMRPKGTLGENVAQGIQGLQDASTGLKQTTQELRKTPEALNTGLQTVGDAAKQVGEGVQLAATDIRAGAKEIGDPLRAGVGGTASIARNIPGMAAGGLGGYLLANMFSPKSEEDESPADREERRKTQHLLNLLGLAGGGGLGYLVNRKLNPASPPKAAPPTPAPKEVTSSDLYSVLGRSAARINY
jgi:hypothetical protein